MLVMVQSYNKHHNCNTEHLITPCTPLPEAPLYCPPHPATSDLLSAAVDLFAFLEFHVCGVIPYYVLDLSLTRNHVFKIHPDSYMYQRSVQ